MLVGCRMDKTTNYANFCSNGAKELKFGSFDGGEESEHNSVGLINISEIFVGKDN